MGVTWGDYNSIHVMIRNIEEIYEKIVYWRKNVSMLPFGKVGKNYIEHINHLLNEEGLHDSPLASIA